MARSEAVRHAFNRGLISPLALARVDLKRAALSAEIQSNWMPRKLGSMMLRAGMGYLGSSRNDSPAQFVEFVRSLSATHLLEFTQGWLRIWTNDALLTRAAVTATVTNGNFNANLANWTDNDEAGAASAWVAGGYMGLTGTGTNAAIRDQQVAVGATQHATEHALRIIVERGPVTLRVGTTNGDDDLVAETTLYSGWHSIAFTPGAANFFIRFMSRLSRIVLVDSCNVEAAGVVEIQTPYLSTDIDYIRADIDSLSVDVMFVGCRSYQQRRIERRAGGRSWSNAVYQCEDGPFRVTNTGTMTMTPSVISGNGTLTSSRPFFKSTQVGGLFRVESVGQTVAAALAVLNAATNSIRVTGVGTDRSFTLVLDSLTGTGNTITLQRSFDNATWTTVADYVADTTTAVLDGLDNQIVYYRLKCTVYAAGSTNATLTIATGSVVGVGRATGYTSPTVMSIEVLSDFGGTTASDTWAEGQWSDYRGWPTCGTLYEGRLGWFGFDNISLSESDAFSAFNPDAEGDSGPIVRTIGSGPMDNINWALPLQRLILGAELAEHSVRSNAFDEPITPSNFNRKQCSSQGSAPVQAVRVDTRGVFVQRGGTRVYELAFDSSSSYDYAPKELTIFNPEACQPSANVHVIRLAVQRQPDLRLHFVLSDGTVAVCVYDPAEDVNCWIRVETDGDVEDACVLPGESGSDEDQVYYHVKRAINGSNKRYLEKWAREVQCQGTFSSSATLNCQADSYVITGAGSRTITAAHLALEEVVVWGNGKDLGTYTLDGAGQAQITETLDANGAVVGLGYDALFKSAKLGQTLSKQKNVDSIAPILYHTHAQGLLMGSDFDHLDALPLVQAGAPVDPDTVYEQYDTDSQTFPGTWDVDARVCLKASAPRPCTVLAAVIEGQVSG